VAESHRANALAAHSHGTVPNPRNELGLLRAPGNCRDDRPTPVRKREETIGRGAAQQGKSTEIVRAMKQDFKIRIKRAQ
jgi:hypothetical protein